MDKRCQLFIKSQLYAYRASKHALELSGHLLGSKRLSHMTLVVLCIDSVFAKLPAEMQQYVQLRYFDRRSESVLDVAIDLNVSERTVYRWDDLIVGKIAKQLAQLGVKIPFGRIG